MMFSIFKLINFYAAPVYLGVLSGGKPLRDISRSLSIQRTVVTLTDN